MHIGRRWTRRSAVAPGIVTPDCAGPARTPGRQPRQAPGLLSSLLDGSEAGGAVLGRDLRVREANHAFAALAGQPTPQDVVGLAAEDLPHLAATEIQEVLRSVLADGRARRFRTGSPDPAAARGRPGTAEATGAAEPTGATGTCHRLAENGRTVGLGLVLVADAPAGQPAGQPGEGPSDAPADALSTETSATGTAAGATTPTATDPTATDPAADLRHARRRLALLDAATADVGTTLDLDTTCAELARFAVPRLAELATVDVLPTAEPGAAAVGSSATDSSATGASASRRLHRAGLARVPALDGPTAALATPGEPVRHRAGSAAARSLAARRPVPADLGAAAADPSPAGPARRADDRAAEGSPAGRQDRAGRSDSESETCRRAGLRGVLAVPLVARDRPLGVLTLMRTADAPGFSAGDIELAQDLARRAAVAIDNARHYARSQGIALELQRALLAEPGNPHPNLDLASRYLPSGTSSVVGGDWFEAVRLSFGRTLLVIGDVMGHGVEAAVDMSDYRSMLRYVAGADLPPHRILRQLDALISENESARPATCLLALADPARNRCTYASAGHLPPALIAPGRPTELVRIPTGPPLGTGVGGYEPAVGTLNPDEVVLLYTDGLVERRGEDIDDSLARLAGLQLPVAGNLDALLDAVLHELAPRAAEDDIAVLAARVRPR
jgi:GAF domain-containing protein